MSFQPPLSTLCYAMNRASSPPLHRLGGRAIMCLNDDEAGMDAYRDPPSSKSLAAASCLVPITNTSRI